MNEKKNNPYILALLTCLIALLQSLSCSVSWGASLHFEAEKGNTTETIQLVADQVEKLAGLKITINYDKKLLSFIKADKSAATSSFLYVVNDKTPGKVIIVMASATGISGDKVPLLHLTFSRKEAAQATPGKISVSQVQLMDESLKEIVADKPEYVIPSKRP